jgi:two-component system, NtrC family, sensor histidine kinase HydH
MKVPVDPSEKPLHPNVGSTFRLLPTWKGNLILFGILILLVILYYFAQMHETERFFFEHTRYQAEMVAGVIRRNAENATLSEKTVEDILTIFLGNSAKFVDYLNSVDLFSSTELTAFAAEAGLAGISIVPTGGRQVDGPENWLPEPKPCQISGLSLHRGVHQYVFSRPMTSGAGCVIVGIDADNIETLLAQVSLTKLLDALSGLDPIVHVRLEKDTFTGSAKSEVTLQTVAGRAVAESRLRMGADTLVVGLDAGNYIGRIRSLWREFGVFCSVLSVLGAFFSWLLYRYQQLDVARVREFDRQLARRQEDAALGLATASIAHEIRNPLNAISMGLQRLQIEAENLSFDHLTLIDALRQAVGRSNDIVTNLKRYAAPLSPKPESVDLNRLVERVLSLYREPCREHGITVRFDPTVDQPLFVDGNLLTQAIENLIKNAVEAQPNGGFVRVSHAVHGGVSVLIFENGGLKLPAEKLERIFEPYMTTKTRGTGLGLPIVKRIVEAHEGNISAERIDPNTLRLTLRLPRLIERGISG